MELRYWNNFRQAVCMILLLALWASEASSLPGQDIINVLPTPPTPIVTFGHPVAVVEQPVAAVAQPALPSAQSLTMEECIQLGFEHQPALAAARASLAAAQTGQHSISRLIIPRIFT